MVQVNVDSNGQNILGDAANEPSLAIDPANPDRMAIGWRQFDNVNSNFRQAGYGYTIDGGQTWTFPAVIEQGVFRSDPVLESDAAGTFYYNSLTSDIGLFVCQVFKSTNGGASWNNGRDAYGGDKEWMTVDRSGGAGDGNIYSFWTSDYSSCLPGFFTRSTNGGNSFESCIEISGNPFWGTMAVGNEGELYIAGSDSTEGIVVAKSNNAHFPGTIPSWDFFSHVDMDGNITGFLAVNPGGLLGQAIIDVDRSEGPGRGNVYVLASVSRISNGDSADVMFAKSTDGGLTWSLPKKINNDQDTSHYQWFGTLSVAPNGRIDMVWLDTRDSPSDSLLSALYYSWSEDQGETWSANVKLSPLFDSRIGWPQQNKMGDYFDMESDENGAHLAWANTFNGEQDVYYSYIKPQGTGFDGKCPPTLLSLSCIPNPFHVNTILRYKIPVECFVELGIFNVYGQQLYYPVNSYQAAGIHTVEIPANDLAPGYYFCRMKAGGQTETIGMVRLE